MYNSKNNANKITITEKDCGLNKGFSSIADAEWLSIDMDMMSSSDYGMMNITDNDFIDRMELELLKEELKQQEHKDNPYDDTFLNELPF